jgi:acyl carrier protein
MGRIDDEVRRKVSSFIARELARDHAGFDVQRGSLVESGIIDSLGIMKLVDFLEKELGIRVEDEDLLPENFETVDAIANLLTAKALA